MPPLNEHSRSVKQRQLKHIISPTAATAAVKERDPFPMKVTAHYKSLINWQDDEDPLKKMVYPAPEEDIASPLECDDPIGDRRHTALELKGNPLLIHRYPDRALLIPTRSCSAHCRFCFRKSLWDQKNTHHMGDNDVQQVCRYLESHKEIREVILSGGDPLTMSIHALNRVFRALVQISHLRTIRVHTRTPIFDPEKITEKMISLFEHFGNMKPIWMVLHCNHARELSEKTATLMRAFIKAGIPLLSQSVLLKGVNDSEERLVELLEALISLKIKPYYLHLLDGAPGTRHFHVPLAKAQTLHRSLRGRLPGYAIPELIWDIPGGHGKIPAGSSWVQRQQDGGTTVRTPHGELLRMAGK